jgi:hypothetical protein
MKTFHTILGYLASLSFLITAFAFIAIRNYLVVRGLVKKQLVYWNPYDFFSKYINSTKEELGKTGIWFWIFIYSGAATLIFGFAEGLLQFAEYILSNI